MKKGTRITLICIIAILMLLVIGGTIFGYVQKYAYAEYTDLNSNSVVNFNQLIPDEQINNTHTNGQYFGVNLPIGTYYFTINSEVSFNLYFVYTGGAYYSKNISVGENKFITSFANNITAIQFSSSGSVSYKYLNAINLGQMFGENNIPNLQQAIEYFSSDYYNYNTGTPMPYSKDYLQGYMDGMSDLSESVSVTINNDIIGNTAFAYNYNGVTSSFAYNGDDNVWLLYGYAAIPIGSTLPQGIVATFDTTTWPNFSGTKYVYYFYSNNSGTLLPLGYVPINSEDNNNRAILTIVLPVDLDTVYIALSDTANFSLSESGLYVFSTALSFKTPNLSAIINNAYNRGYYSATNEYAEQSTKWLDIYYQGVRYGQQHNGFNDAWDFVGSAFSGIGRIFSLELLPNVPLSTFILVPLMVSLIFFVVKLVKGGGN